jgi:hypothetical protein
LGYTCWPWRIYFEHSLYNLRLPAPRFPLPRPPQEKPEHGHASGTWGGHATGAEHLSRRVTRY